MLDKYDEALDRKLASHLVGNFNKLSFMNHNVIKFISMFFNLWQSVTNWCHSRCHFVFVFHKVGMFSKNAKKAIQTEGVNPQTLGTCHDSFRLCIYDM